MYALYSLAWLLALPLAFLYLLWRSRRQPEYRRHWSERLGFGPSLGGQRVIWIHAVSVGETRAAAPIINALLKRHPGHTLLLTHATPTGRATGEELFGERVRQAYLPYDFPLCVAIFLARTRPEMGVIMETELWPNLFRACRKRNIPLLLVNARLSARSAQGYQRFAGLARGALQDLAAIAAQTPADAQRLEALGARHVVVTGNVKFDVTPPADTAQRGEELRRTFGNRFVFLCASTREGEEPLLLEALSKIQTPDLLVVLVPRHPQRFEAVASLLKERGMAFVRRSEQRPVPEDMPVFLGDSMGEMAAYYAAADLCYVGGSLVPLGGQNMIEAAAAGCPALIGPHTWNFMEAAEQAVASGTARRVADAAELGNTILALRDDPPARQRMAEAGRAFAQANRGATEKILGLMEARLPPAPSTHPSQGRRNRQA